MTTPRRKRELVHDDAHAFTRGARAAAAIADDYNSSSTHPYRLGDCILDKLNLRERPGPPRKNRMRIDDPQNAWICGFAMALADVYRLLVDGNDGKSICKIAHAAGVSLDMLRAAGVPPQDIRALKRAGVL
jgi:hypothetical protein